MLLLTYAIIYANIWQLSFVLFFACGKLSSYEQRFVCSSCSIMYCILMGRLFHLVGWIFEGAISFRFIYLFSNGALEELAKFNILGASFQTKGEKGLFSFSIIPKLSSGHPFTYLFVEVLKRILTLGYLLTPISKWVFCILQSLMPFH